MSRFLRNAIASARDPRASLQPLVPSLYAELDGRGQDALEVEPLIAGGAAEEERTGRRRRGPPGESTRETGESELRSTSLKAPDVDAAPEALPPRVMEEAGRLRGPLRRPTPSLRDDPRGVSNTPATSDAAAGAPADVGGPRHARSSLDDTGDADARGPLAPPLREPWHAAEARRPLVTTSSQRPADVETRVPRTGSGRSAATGNDVEIHIGRIEVIAAAPTVRAPPKSTQKSPSLGDYLNGRRGRRP